MDRSFECGWIEKDMHVWLFSWRLIICFCFLPSQKVPSCFRSNLPKFSSTRFESYTWMVFKPKRFHRNLCYVPSRCSLNIGRVYCATNRWAQSRWLHVGTVNSWLVVWNMNFIFPYIGNVIIPIDELIFFRGVAEPKTRQYQLSITQLVSILNLSSTKNHHICCGFLPHFFAIAGPCHVTPGRSLGVLFARHPFSNLHSCGGCTVLDSSQAIQNGVETAGVGLKLGVWESYYWLLVWNIFYFPIYWECHHPKPDYVRLCDLC